MPDRPRNEKGQYVKVSDAVSAAESQHVERLHASMSRYQKTVARVTEAYASLSKAFSSKLQAGKSWNDTVAKMNQHLTANARYTRDASRAQSAFGASIVKWATAAAAALSLYRRTVDLVQTRMHGALTLGPGMIARLPGMDTNQMRLLGGIVGKSPALRFGATTGQLGAIVSMEKVMKPFGEAGREMIGDYLKTFGDDSRRMFQFLDTVASRGLDSALKRFVSNQNIMETVSLQNALQMKQEEKAGSLDPVLKSTMEVTAAMEQLDAALDKAIESGIKALEPALTGLADKATRAADALSKMSPGNQALAVGAAATLPWTLPWLVKGAGKLIGGGAVGAAGAAAGGGGMAIPTIVGFGAPGGVAAAGGLAAGWLALPLIEGVVGGAAIGYQSYRLHQERQLLAERQAEVGGMQGAWARSVGKMPTDTARQKLLVERQKLMLAISSTGAQGEQTGFWHTVRGAFGLGGDQYSNETLQRIEGYRAKVRDINAQIAQLDQQHKTAAGSGSSSFSRLLETAKEYAQKGLGAIKEGWNKVLDKAGEAREAQIKANAAAMPQATLSAATRASMTQVSRMEMELASQMIPGLGRLGAVPQMNAFLRDVDKQIEALQHKLSLIVENTDASKIEANGIRSEIIALQMEAVQTRHSLIQAVLDSSIQAAFSSGRFSKTIITKDYGILRGMKKGMVAPNIEASGILGKRGWSDVEPYRLTGNMPLDYARLTQRAELQRQMRESPPNVARAPATGDALLDAGKRCQEAGGNTDANGTARKRETVSTAEFPNEPQISRLSRNMSLIRKVSGQFLNAPGINRYGKTSPHQIPQTKRRTLEKSGE